MKHEATVVRSNGKLVAEIVRTEACGSCNACSFGRKEKLHFPLPSGDFQEGERVYVETGDTVLGRATMLAYVLPLVLFLAGLAAGAVIFKAEWAQALTGILFLAGSLMILRFTEKKRRDSEIYACRAHKIDTGTEE